tara:strand:+ start:466 stop:1338 length:873 start_codon:yes stop_codon:yes gene_type:complete
MKIAILGTSPIMVLMAHKLSKKNDITIFEQSKNYGGAWSWSKFFGSNINTKTNVVLPASSKQESLQKKIIDFFLSEFKIKAKITDNSYFFQDRIYKTKKLYEFDLFNSYKKIFLNPKIKIKRKKVININLKEKIIINNAHEFDKLYVPFFFGINKYQILGKVIKTNYKIITSKHLFIACKENIFKNFYYNENFNNFLNRAQVQKRGNTFFFRARIKKKYKKYSLQKLIRLNVEKKFINRIITAKIIKYNHYFRNKDQLKMLNKIIRKNKIYLVDTREFVMSFLKYKLYKR